MDLLPNEDQAALLEATNSWLLENLELSKVRTQPADIFEQMAQMGWYGIATNEDIGGLGEATDTEALIFSALGKYLAPLAIISTTIGARMFGGSEAAEFISGNKKIALGIIEDGLVRVLDAQDAQYVAIFNKDNSAIYQIPQGTNLSQGLDLTFKIAKIDFSRLGDAIVKKDGDKYFQELQILTAAYALGVADRAVEMATEYAKIREQFGKQIGSFQALKHMMSDCFVAATTARAQIIYAACTIAQDAENSKEQIASAKLLADNAAINNCRANIQIHGGIGMTDEADPHLLLKRAHILNLIAQTDIEDILS